MELVIWWKDPVLELSGPLGITPAPDLRQLILTCCRESKEGALVPMCVTSSSGGSDSAGPRRRHVALFHLKKVAV